MRTRLIVSAVCLVLGIVAIGGSLITRSVIPGWGGPNIGGGLILGAGIITVIGSFLHLRYAVRWRDQGDPSEDWLQR